MPPPSVTLYFDMQSPFAYLAFYFLERSPTFKSCAITYIPIYVSGLLTLNNSSAPWRVQNKGTWLESERLSWARRFNIPMANVVPEGWPMSSTIRVQRALTALYMLSKDKLDLRELYISAIEALFTTFWVERKPVHSPDMFEKIMESVLGKDLAERVTKKSERGEVRELLRKNTQEAFDGGAFGIPWIVAVDSTGRKEQFWGFDRLGLVAEFLGLGTPLLLEAESGYDHVDNVKRRQWPAHL